jgi:hypothetical protein
MIHAMNSAPFPVRALVFCALAGGLLLAAANFSQAAEAPKRELTPMTFEQIGYWKFVDGKTPIPDDVKKFNGKYVEIKGYMLPVGGGNWCREFLLVPSLFGCCFGRAPEPNHLIFVKMQGKKEAPYHPRPIRIRGTFTASEERVDGLLVSLYRFECEQVLEE